MFVPVIDQHQQPLMPTTPARARRWIKSGKATAFWKGGLFCIRLNAEPSAREIQPLAVGIDPGSKREGYSVLSAAHTYLNIQADARDGVKEAEQEKAPTFYQGPLAVEAASGPVPLPALPGQRLRGRGHQGGHAGKKALGSKLFSPGSRQTVVLRGTLEAG
jgi:RRXRR protein